MSGVELIVPVPTYLVVQRSIRRLLGLHRDELGEYYERVISVVRGCETSGRGIPLWLVREVRCVESLVVDTLVRLGNGGDYARRCVVTDMYAEYDEYSDAECTRLKRDTVASEAPGVVRGVIGEFAERFAKTLLGTSGRPVQIDAISMARCLLLIRVNVDRRGIMVDWGSARIVENPLHS